MSTRPDIRLERSAELLPESREVAERELRETPERSREALERLRELLRENPDLFFGDDDDILTIFLRPCKWYPESALALMRRVAEFKKDYSSLLAGLMPMHEEEAFLHHTVANVLTQRDHKNRRILVVNCGGTWDPKKLNVDQMFRMFYLIHVASLLEHETQVNGSVMIMDYHEMGWAQAKAFTPSSSKRLLTFLQDAMPCRLKEVHIVRQPMAFNILWSLFKPFIKEKLKNRLIFHGSKMESLHKYIPATHLPSNFGGELPAVDYTAADWYPVLRDCEPHIQTWDSFGFKKT